MTLVTCVRLGLLLVWMCSVCWAASKPNIIIFYVDDVSWVAWSKEGIKFFHYPLSLSLSPQLGYGDLSPYGHPTSFTPNIQKMADSGLVLTNFYTNSPASSPSRYVCHHQYTDYLSQMNFTSTRAGLLTGRYQMRSGVYPGEFDPTHLGGETFSAVMWQSCDYVCRSSLQWDDYCWGTKGSWIFYCHSREMALGEEGGREGGSVCMSSSLPLPPLSLSQGVGEDGKFLPHNHGFDYYLVRYNQWWCTHTHTHLQKMYPLPTRLLDPKAIKPSITQCSSQGLADVGHS